eukprot:m.652141 g.652141  ORF g.652141 m.652141 type:complete len:433 (-) comp22688_c0_seq4:2877-4175(-)
MGILQQCALVGAMTVFATAMPSPAVKAPLYGIATGNPASLISVDTTTGKKTPIGKPFSNELAAQQLSAIDANKDVYYILDFNDTSRKPNLLGLSLADGSIKVDLTIDLDELAFVGVGQSVGVDPLTGLVIINGHDSTVQGHHFISVDPWSATPSKATSICKIPAPNVYLLGGSSTVDWDAGVMYAMLVMPPADGSAAAVWEPFNTTADIQAQARYVPNRAPEMIVKQSADGAPPPPPPPPFSVQLMAIDYKAKTFKAVPTGRNLGTLAYDEVKKSVVGFSEEKLPDGTYAKTLMAMSTAGARTLTKIGDVKGLNGEMGPITTVDSQSRVHYSFLQPPPAGWKTSTKCASDGFPCKAGTSCCFLPPDEPACFAVASCSDMHNGPNITAPFLLAQLNLDTAASVVAKPPPICSIAGNDCPWSIEAAEKQTWGRN